MQSLSHSELRKLGVMTEKRTGGWLVGGGQEATFVGPVRSVRRLHHQRTAWANLNRLTVDRVIGASVGPRMPPLRAMLKPTAPVNITRSE